MIYFLGRKLHCFHCGILIIRRSYSLPGVSTQTRYSSTAPTSRHLPAPPVVRSHQHPGPAGHVASQASRDSRAARGPQPPAASSFPRTPHLRWLESFPKIHYGDLGQVPEGRFPSGSTSMTPRHLLHHAVSQCAPETRSGGSGTRSQPYR